MNARASAAAARLARMPALVALTTLVLAALGLPSAAPLGRDIETSALAASRLEIVVIEERDCLYCRLFRRDLFPAYAAPPRAREVPMRFLDAGELAASRLTLKSAVDVVPTILVLADGAEIGRVPGYATREIFFRAINALLSQQQ
jgi:thioredoxin-related protein